MISALCKGISADGVDTGAVKQGGRVIRPALVKRSASIGAIGLTGGNGKTEHRIIVQRDDHLHPEAMRRFQDVVVRRVDGNGIYLEIAPDKGKVGIIALLASRGAGVQALTASFLTKLRLARYRARTRKPGGVIVGASRLRRIVNSYRRYSRVLEKPI
jgi:hypothetical protein